MAKLKRYRLMEDNDGHWYIIPAAKVEEFWAWIKAMEDHGDMNNAHGFIPLGGSPHSVTFTDWQTE